MKYTMKKKSRTISGVTPVAVVTRPMDCPGRCVFCPTFSGTPQSYTPESPAILRAIKCDYDPRKQVELRLRILSDMGHPTDKVELIVLGGTFLALPREYQYQFILDCYAALNGRDGAGLEEAKHLNETARHRLTGLCIETRPDYCGPAEIERLLEFGVTRVELGVQMIDDKIYRLTNRGHDVAAVIRATRLLKMAGLKVHYHWMPGLPGSSPEKDLALTGRLFSDACFRPDGLKLYPTMVVAGTELERWQRDGHYRPYDDATMIDLIASIKAIVPRYVRISRVLRDIPAKFIVGGLKDSLREVVKKRLGDRGIECQCIRCREYGHRLRDGRASGEPRLMRLDYPASRGREIFLSYEDESGTLFGLLRLRIQDSPAGGFEPASYGHVALVRELHVYGPEVPVGGQETEAVQHKGLGKALLREAERISGEEFRVPWVLVLSGIGARQYYRLESGYELKGYYMAKKLSPVNPKTSSYHPQFA